MKNNEMAIRDVVSLKLPEKFAEDHPVAAAAVVLVPIVLPYAWKITKYIVDKSAETSRFKVLVENGYVPSDGKDGFETTTDETNTV